MNLTDGVAVAVLAISYIGSVFGSAPDCSIFAGKKYEEDRGYLCENCTELMDTDGSAAEGVIFVETTQTDTDTTRIAELLEALLVCEQDLDKKYFTVWVDRYGCYGNYTGLMVAAQHDLAKIVETFLSHGADPNIEIYIEMKNVRDNALTQAASKNVFALLIDNGADRDEAFHIAASKGYEDIVANLLDKGVNIDNQEKGVDNMTALMTAAMSGSEEVLTLLIEKGANMNLHCKDGYTALTYSLFTKYSRSNELDSCFMTLLKRGADVRVKNLKGRTILLQISSYCEENCAMYYQALVDYGANINDKDNNGITALMLEAKYGQGHYYRHLGMAKLIELGAEVNAQDLDGNTALIWAVSFFRTWEGLRPVVSLLLASGADPNIRNNRLNVPLLTAAKHPRGAGLIDALVEKGANVNAHDDERRTALINAAKYGCRDNVDRLLDHGADINAQSKSGMTALHFAVRNLDRASQSVHREMHLYLVDRGADTLIRNKDGFTAAQLAYEKMFYSRQSLGIW